MASQIQFLNPQLDKDFREALARLVCAHSTDKKSVSLTFSGKGRRPVRVGYIQDSPIWKTSYRLVLDDKQCAVPSRLGDRGKYDRARLARYFNDACKWPAGVLHHGSLRAEVHRSAGGGAGIVWLTRAATLRAGHVRPRSDSRHRRPIGRPGMLLPTMNNRSQEPYVTSVVPGVGPANGNRTGSGMGGMGGMMGGLGGGGGGGFGGGGLPAKPANDQSLDLNRGVKVPPRPMKSASCFAMRSIGRCRLPGSNLRCCRSSTNQ